MAGLLPCIVRVFLSLLILATAFVIAPDRAEPAAAGFRSANGRLMGPDGRPFYIVGANYEGPLDRAWQMWADDKWDPARIDLDLARAEKAGLNALRVFVQSPLARDVDAGKFGKLDTFVDLAAKRKLALIITLYDYGDEDLTKIAATGARIAARYKDKPTILAYDLKNEPKYANLVLAKYPAGVTPPLLADGLIAKYGERMPMSDVDAWRNGDGKAMSPSRFSDREVYITANNYKLYREFLADASVWVSARDSASSAEYQDAPESAKWRPFIDAMSGTLAAWLAPQVAAVRGADPDRLLTVGYNDPILARLAGNEALTFLSMHRYPGTSAKSLVAYLGTMDTMRKALPGRPVALTEFGWSNATIDPNDSALLEAATWLHLYQGGHAGALKWMLDDLPPVGDPKEDNLGMFTTTGAAKPVVAVTSVLGPYLNRGVKGQLTLEAEDAGLRYRYVTDDAMFLGGRTIGDTKIAAKPNATTQVFVQWSDALRVQVTTKTDLDLNVTALTGRPLGANAVLQRGDAPVPATKSGDRLAFSADSGAEYRVKVPVTAIDSRIQIVWPLGNAPVAQADKANVGVYLFNRGSKQAVCPETPVRLWRSVNNGVEEPVGVGVRKNERAGELVFPSWSFNDVDVSPAKDAANKVFFRVSADGIPTYGTIWSHGADARTIFPQPDVPTEAAGVPAAVDAKIEIVWPQGNLPVAQADRANIGVFVFHRGTLRSVGADYSGVVRLWRAIGSGPMEPIATGTRATTKVGDLVVPIWSFNDVDVSAAKNPASKVYFRASVDGIDSRGNIWSHAADARTIFPERDVPTAGCG